MCDFAGGTARVERSGPSECAERILVPVSAVHTVETDRASRSVKPELRNIVREHRTRLGLVRTRWSAVGAAVAVTLGAGGLSMAQAAIDTGDRPVTVTIAAERILDTRTDLGLSGRFVDGASRDLQVTGSVPTASGGSKSVVPAEAVGVLVNVTVVAPTHEGFLSLRPQGATGEPTTSTVNFFPGAIEPNGATVDLNNGQIQIWVETSADTGTADVLIDVVGYTIGHTHDDRYYTEAEVDAAVGVKANSADVYTKTETDAAIPVIYFAQVTQFGTIDREHQPA